MSVSNEILVERQTVDGLDITFVEQEGVERLRACVLFPFDPHGIQTGKVPHQTPHLLEHVVCCGDKRSRSAAALKEASERHGGYSNAHTSPWINGLLSFETDQPDTGVDVVLNTIRAVFYPAMRPKDIKTERQIVVRELEGYLHDPVRQRFAEMGYHRGIRYSTDRLGLAGLSGITAQDLAVFHAAVFTRQNARIVLTGSPAVTRSVAATIRADIAPGLPDGTRVYAANGDVVPSTDYHAPAAEIPAGMTEYSHCRVARNAFAAKLARPDISIIANAFYACLAEGRDGIVEQSRNQGLSYGLNPSWQINRRQVSLAVSDRVSVASVDKHIKLLSAALARVASTYNAAAFDDFRRKRMGRIKMYPDDLFKFVTGVEMSMPVDDAYEVVEPRAYRKALAQIDPAVVVDAVRSLAERLLEPDFVVQHAFGDNPFARQPEPSVSQLAV